jgi:hypothetical protein
MATWKVIDLFSKLTSNDTLSTIKIADATLERYSSSLLKLLNRLDIETTSEMDTITLSR